MRRRCSHSCARSSSVSFPPVSETLDAAIAEMRIRAPAQRNRKLEALLDRVNEDTQLKAWWHMQQTTATRLGMSDHGWVHVQKVLNIALRLFRLLEPRGVEPAVVRDHGMTARD